MRESDDVEVSPGRSQLGRSNSLPSELPEVRNDYMVQKSCWEVPCREFPTPPTRAPIHERRERGLGNTCKGTSGDGAIPE